MSRHYLNGIEAAFLDSDRTPEEAFSSWYGLIAPISAPAIRPIFADFERGFEDAVEATIGSE